MNARLREQYESIVNVATVLMNECKRLESRLEASETMLVEQAEDFKKAKADIFRQLSESQKEVERLTKENVLHVIAHTEAGAELKRLRSENENLRTDLKTYEGSIAQLRSDLAEAYEAIANCVCGPDGYCAFCDEPEKPNTVGVPHKPDCIVLKGSAGR